jgi:DivIVA domain-containing protein
MTLSAADVRAVTFRSKLRGYDPAAVDAALEEIAVALERGRPLARVDLDALEFGPRLRGYHPADVDAFIDRLRLQAR